MRARATRACSILCARTLMNRASTASGGLTAKATSAVRPPVALQQRAALVICVAYLHAYTCHSLPFQVLQGTYHATKEVGHLQVSPSSQSVVRIWSTCRLRPGISSELLCPDAAEQLKGQSIANALKASWGCTGLRCSHTCECKLHSLQTCIMRGSEAVAWMYVLSAISGSLYKRKGMAIFYIVISASGCQTLAGHSMQSCKPSYATMCSLRIHALWLLNGANYTVISLHYSTSRNDMKSPMLVYMCMHALHLTAAYGPTASLAGCPVPLLLTSSSHAPVLLKRRQFLLSHTGLRSQPWHPSPALHPIHRPLFHPLGAAQPSAS